MFRMRLAGKLLIAHFAFSVLLWLAVHGVRAVQCDGVCGRLEYIGALAFFIINFPGISLSGILVSYTIDESVCRTILRDFVMVVSSELVFYLFFSSISWLRNRIFRRGDA